MTSYTVESKPFLRAKTGSHSAVVFAASIGLQSSPEDVSWGNGAFIKALVEGLNGGGALFDWSIKINTLDASIARRVKELTGGRQTPTTHQTRHNTGFSDCGEEVNETIGRDDNVCE